VRRRLPFADFGLLNLPPPPIQKPNNQQIICLPSANGYSLCCGQQAAAVIAMSRKEQHQFFGTWQTVERRSECDFIKKFNSFIHDA